MPRWRFQWCPTLVFTVLSAIFGVPGIRMQSPVLDAALGAVFGFFIGVTLAGFIQTRACWRFRWLPTLVFSVLGAILGVPGGIRVQSPVLDAGLGAVFGFFIGVTLGGFIQTRR